MTVPVAGFTAPGSVLERDDIVGISDVVNSVLAESSKSPRLASLEILRKGYRFQMLRINAPRISAMMIKNLPIFKTAYLKHEHVPVSQPRTVDHLGQFAVTVWEKSPKPSPASRLHNLEIGFRVWRNGGGSIGRPGTPEALIMLTTHAPTQGFIPISTLTVINKTCRYHYPDDTRLNERGR